MKITKKIIWAVVILFIAIQFYRPEKNVGKDDHATYFITETNPSKEVRAIMERNCYDCHSNNTVYPWYNNVAPVSFWLAKHVKDGKKHLNFSDWEGYELKKKDHKLEEVIEMVEDGVMPLKEYTWTHEDARLTIEQRDAIVEWAKSTRALYQLNQQPE